MRVPQSPLIVGWHSIASLVFVFAGWVAIALSTAKLDPLGMPYYGVVVDFRMDVLFTLLAAFEVVSLVDAVVLGRRKRRAWFWAAMALMVLVVPFALVVSVAQIDVWRYEHRGTPARGVIAGTAMFAAIGAAYVLRGWLWRATEIVGRPEHDVSGTVS